MAWLGKRRHKRPSKEEQEEERGQREAEAKRARNRVASPPLVLLVPDVAGVSSYRMHRLRDAPAACDFVQSSLSWQKKSGINIHAFWALQREPATDSGSPAEGDEAMVLIRTAEGSDIVYVVSFVDIESAQSFARFEVKRGLGLGLIMIYWASLVTITESEEGVRVTPELPPRVEPGLASERASAVAPMTAKRGADESRRRQLEEKKRLQEELAEMQRRQVISEQRRRQLEEKRRLEAEVAEMRRRQAETEALREAEGSGARSGADETGKGLEEEDKRRLQAEAEEVAELKTQAEALRKQQAEAREIARLKAQAHALRKQLAEAEEQLRREAQQRLMEATGEQDTEAAEKERVQSNTEERRRLEAELADVQRRQAEAEERHRQAEVLGTRRRETIDQEHRQAEPEAREQEAIEKTPQEAEEVIWTEAAAEEVARFNAGSDAVEAEPSGREAKRRWEDAQAEEAIRDEEFESEVSRFDADAEDSSAIGEWPPRLPVDAADGRTVERPKTRSLPEALDEISPGLAEALQKAAQDKDAQYLEPPVPIDSGTAEESTGDTGTEFRPLLDEWAVEESPEEQVRAIDDDATDPQQTVVPQPSQDAPIPAWLRHEGYTEDREQADFEETTPSGTGEPDKVSTGLEEFGADEEAIRQPEADTELPADEAFANEEIEEGAARDGAVTAEPPLETPGGQIGNEEYEKELAEAHSEGAGPNGAGAPQSEQVSVEVEKMLGKRRWEKRDSPFRGFDSPPGRF